jgi:hypothetical protein
MTCGHFFDDRPEEAALPFETSLILGQETIEVRIAAHRRPRVSPAGRTIVPLQSAQALRNLSAACEISSSEESI